MRFKPTYISFDSHSNIDSRCISVHSPYPSPVASASYRIQLFAHAQLPITLRLDPARLQARPQSKSRKCSSAAVWRARSKDDGGSPVCIRPSAIG